MKELILKKEGERLTASLNCEIDHHTAKLLREEIDVAMRSGEVKVLILDFSGVGFMDSSGIGLILGRANTAEEIGASVRLCGLSPSLIRIVRMSGIEKIQSITVEKRGV